MTTPMIVPHDGNLPPPPSSRHAREGVESPRGRGAADVRRARTDSQRWRAAAPVRDATRRARDVTDIEELLLRYLLGLHACDAELVRSCFAEGSRARAVAPGESVEGRASPHGPPDGASAPRHYYSLYSLAVGEAEAEAVVYYCRGRGARIDAPPFGYSAFTTYRCRRTQAGWRFVDVVTNSLPESTERGPDLEGPREALEEPGGAPSSRAGGPPFEAAG